MATLRALVERAPDSLDAVMELLISGLGWPVPDDIEVEDAFIDWQPEELHLDPQVVAKLTSIRQMRPLTSGQPVGVFFLTFEGGRLPVGALRRLVDRLVRKKRPRGPGTHPVWGLDDLLFVVQAAGETHTVHLVAFKDTGGKQALKVISWGSRSTPTRLELVARRIARLAWPASGVPSLEWRDRWREVFTAGEREGIRTAAALANRMAAVARDVRDEVIALYEVETASGPMRALYADVRQHLLHDITPARFADMYAQTMVYGLLTARITHPERFAADAGSALLDFENPFLDAVYSRFHDETGETFDVDELGLHDLAEELARTDVDEILADFGTADRRDDPVVHFYEEFLTRYDPEQRVRLGAFYTPTPVVRWMVAAVDAILRTRLGLPLGIADRATWAEVADRLQVDIPEGVESDAPFVAMIDPATGTGTFLVEWLRVAREGVSEAVRAEGASGDAADAAWHEWLQESLLPHMDAFELSLASYAVAHLKVSLLLPEEVRRTARLPIYLTDTLAGRALGQLPGFTDPVSVEGENAERVKFETPHTVVVGNPPYDRVTADAVRGWLHEPRVPSGPTPLDDILKPATENTIFSHIASLYNLYVYFWRWALWKAFEQHDGPAVVSFITASSWLTGPGFLGLRELARRLADEMWVMDLGGDNRGTHPEQNVFDIETPVAIVLIARRGRSDPTRPAHVSYRRVNGSRAEKLAVLEDDAHDLDDGWTQAPADWHDPLVPPTGDESWLTAPALADLFPWQQPGAMFNRTWPIAPDPESLAERWTALLAEPDPDERSRRFYTGGSGRNIFTQVGRLPRLADLPRKSPHAAIVRYGMRSFDRQWTFADPRLAKTESPSLWAGLSPRQIFMTTLMTARLGKGPAATTSTAVPDKHYFSGRGGKDVIPLYRDADGTPNCAASTLDAITAAHRSADPDALLVTAERLFAYAYAILAGADYTTRFADALETPGPRVPLTSEPALFGDVAAFGEELLWLHTFGERCAEGRPDGISPLQGLVVMEPIRRLPDRAADIRYDPISATLRIGDGVVQGVRDDVWAFEVSGMQVVRKWLSYRMARPGGRAASSSSPLDAIRPSEWLDEWTDELLDLVTVLTSTLDLRLRGTELLDRVLAGPLVSALDLPGVPPELRQPPAVPPPTPDVLFARA
jgi:hypothetical protein